jgi:CRP-like cAMP-binding protein
MGHQHNSFLNSLPKADLDAIEPHLKNVELKQHRVIYEPFDKIELVQFPFDAVISLVVVLRDGKMVEAAMVGNDGVVGGAAALDSRTAINRAIVQLGGRGLECRMDDIQKILDSRPTLQKAFVRHQQTIIAQTQQSAACNVSHDVEARLARWLLRAADLSGNGELNLTQEYLAEMLGVRRTSVSVVAHTLQRAGLIEYVRGRIRIVDRRGLEETACECYEAVKESYATLLK